MVKFFLVVTVEGIDAGLSGESGKMRTHVEIFERREALLDFIGRGNEFSDKSLKVVR